MLAGARRVYTSYALLSKRGALLSTRPGVRNSAGRKAKALRGGVVVILSYPEQQTPSLHKEGDALVVARREHLIPEASEGLSVTRGS